jgi:hypothetical protein
LGLKVGQLRPDGHCVFTKAKTTSLFPDYALTLSGGVRQAFDLVQGPVFADGTPLDVDSWDDLMQMNVPTMDIRSRNTVFLSAANAQYPISNRPPLSDEEKFIRGVVQKEEILQAAAVKATREDANLDTSRKAMMVMAVAILVLSAMLAFPTLKALGWVGGSPATQTVTVPREVRPEETLRRIDETTCTAYVPALQAYISVECP